MIVNGRQQSNESHSTLKPLSHFQRDFHWSCIVFMPCCKLKENTLKLAMFQTFCLCSDALKIQFQGSACENIYLSMVNWQTEYVDRIVPGHMSCSMRTEKSQWIWSASVLFQCPVIWKITLVHWLNGTHLDGTCRFQVL